MKARTRTLFHFTKSLETVMRILQEGFWPKYSLEDTSWIDPRVPRLAWPMVSFCDIPISRLCEHTDFYGSYGIGLCRQQWKAYGLNPLLYVSPDSMLIRELRELLLAATSNSNRRIRTCANVLLAHCKSLAGFAERNGQRCPKDFYAECEWRFLPWVEGDGGENKFGFWASPGLMDTLEAVR
jgi:hypothetical protein